MNLNQSENQYSKYFYYFSFKVNVKSQNAILIFIMILTFMCNNYAGTRLHFYENK